MSIPDPIETFMLRLGFEYSTLPVSSERPPRPPEAEEWSRTFALIADRVPVLAVVPARCRVDHERLRRVAGVGSVRPATPDEVADFYPESEPGRMPPLGPFYGQRVFVDEALTHHDYVVFNAGTGSDAIRMRYGDFAELVHPTVGSFAVRG